MSRKSQESVFASLNDLPQLRPSSTLASAPVLQYTPLDEIKPNVSRLHQKFHSESNKLALVQFRLNQLRNLYFAIKDNVEAICGALEEDFYRSPSETQNLEISPSLNELLHTMSLLHKWITPEKVTHLSLSMKSNPVYLERIPLGVILIMSPFNYPLLLSLSPIAGAIAAGNAVVFKPTELTPRFSALITKLFTQALDPDIFYVVNGAIPESTTTLEQKFDKIMYTGNGTVGTIIAKKAAETLTPVILELGGKSPAFVLPDVSDKDLNTIARRIVWGRFTNGGQTCVAVDYVLVHDSLKSKLVAEMKRVVQESFYAGINENTTSYTHIIHERAYDNLKDILKTTKGDIVVGGQTDDSSRYLSPTIIDNVTWSDSSMKHELFGPILPVLTYRTLDEAIENVTKNHDTPLVLYLFTSGPTSRKGNKNVDKIMRRLRSGATLVNDVIIHVGLVNAPFGGIGTSGYLSYHGFYSFRAFTHERTILEQKLRNERTLSLRYPPFNDKKTKAVGLSMDQYNGNLWFGRVGDVTLSGPSRFFSIWAGISGVAALGSAVVAAL